MFQGADVSALDSLAQKTEHGAEFAREVALALKILVRALEAMSWTGFAAAFAAYLESVVIPWVEAVGRALKRFAAILKAASALQKAASEDSPQISVPASAYHAVDMPASTQVNPPMLTAPEYAVTNSSMPTTATGEGGQVNAPAQVGGTSSALGQTGAEGGGSRILSPDITITISESGGNAGSGTHTWTAPQVDTSGIAAAAGGIAGGVIGGTAGDASSGISGGIGGTAGGSAYPTTPITSQGGIGSSWDSNGSSFLLSSPTGPSLSGSDGSSTFDSGAGARAGAGSGIGSSFGSGSGSVGSDGSTGAGGSSLGSGGGSLGSGGGSLGGSSAGPGTSGSGSGTGTDSSGPSLSPGDPSTISAPVSASGSLGSTAAASPATFGDATPLQSPSHSGGARSAMIAAPLGLAGAGAAALGKFRGKGEEDDPDDD